MHNEIIGFIFYFRLISLYGTGAYWGECIAFSRNLVVKCIVKETLCNFGFVLACCTIMYVTVMYKRIDDVKPYIYTLNMFVLFREMWRTSLAAATPITGQFWWVSIYFCEWKQNSTDVITVTMVYSLNRCVRRGFGSTIVTWPILCLCTAVWRDWAFLTGKNTSAFCVCVCVREHAQYDLTRFQNKTKKLTLLEQLYSKSSKY